MKKVLKLLKYILQILVILVIVWNVYSLYQKKKNQNPFPMAFGYGTALIGSGSMEPTYSWGDLIIVHAKSEYKTDDVVTFLQEGDARSTTHRIVKQQGDTIVTQGDANNTTDPPIKKKQIYGKVILAIPYVGYLLRIFVSPLGLLLAIGIFLLMYYFDTRKK